MTCDRALRFRRSRPALLFVLTGLAAVGLEMSTATAATAATEAPAVAAAVLEWKATKEDGVYGYLVYRSADREGPFRRVGREIVPVSRESDEIHSYRFEDTTVEAGKTYHYYLDKIAKTGVKSRLSGVVAKTIPAR